MEGFTITPLQQSVEVEGIVTVHYFEYTNRYYFDGERHNFWELLYVDRGELTVAAEGEERVLRRGDLIFHKPGEFHALHNSSNGVSAPNLVVVTFLCRSPHMAWFENRVLTVGDRERSLLGRMVAEAELAFSTPLGDPLTQVMVRWEDAPLGAEQLLGAALEELLVCLLRGGTARQAPTSLMQENAQQVLVGRVGDYMEARLSQRLNLEALCRAHLVGRSYLQRAFHAQTGGGAMEYFAALRIDAAKRMIREGGGNLTEIFAALGYGSIYYFSRSFKKVHRHGPRRIRRQRQENRGEEPKSAMMRR